MGNQCEVEGCNGVYVTETVSYVRLRGREDVTLEEYEKLEDKKGCVAVVSELCNVCNDDLNDRLVGFINKHSHAFVN
jgi:hypothetical protein